MAAPACPQPGCTGTIYADGYCDTCGAKFVPVAASPPVAVGAPTAAPSGTAAPAGAAGAAVGTPSARVGSVASPVPPSTRTRGASRRTDSSRRSTSSRARVGAGLVAVAPTPVGDPSIAVMTDDEIAEVIESVPEAERFCSSCGKPVGRAANGRPGRAKGFCGNCRTPFDFSSNEPTLTKGEMVGGQYEIVGCLAHGGLGWIYLARDTAVSNRWVVLKGLLNSSDPDAIEAAVAERQYLASVEHGNIVRIYNFVTWRGAGYIVMEYVGGESLNAKLKGRRRANNGVPDPLPVADALAYVLAILPAFAHLHSLGLLYNDLKPANIMAVGDDVKLIDLGAVMRATDASAAVFGTQGFQAPEVAVEGPSVSSDVYTVGRTIAVLILNFVYHEGPLQYALPSQQDEPIFAVWESLYRFLLKCTATAPSDRFDSIDELADQLHGVLREIVARTERRPHPATSTRFTGDQLPSLFAALGDTVDVAAPSWRALPVPLVDVTDPAAAVVMGLPAFDPATAYVVLAAAVAEQRVEPTREVELRLARAMVDDRSLGGTTTAEASAAALDALERGDPWDWRVDWYRGTEALATGDAVGAADRFSRVWTDLPGELAPKMAVALAAETAGDTARAAELYDIVLTTDDSWVSAAFGLARCRRALGQFDEAVVALDRVPTTSAVYIDAQIAVARARVGADTVVDAADLDAAAAIIDRLLLDARTRSQMQVEVLERVLHALPTAAPGTLPASLFGAPLDERSVRKALERGYRDLARSSTTKAERYDYVDKANRVRPRTLV